MKNVIVVEIKQQSNTLLEEMNQPVKLSDSFKSQSNSLACEVLRLTEKLSNRGTRTALMIGGESCWLNTKARKRVTSCHLRRKLGNTRFVTSSVRIRYVLGEFSGGACLNGALPDELGLSHLECSANFMRLLRHSKKTKEVHTRARTTFKSV